MGSLLRLRAAIARGVVILVLAEVGVFGCRAGPRDGPAPLQDAPGPARECYPAVDRPVVDGLTAALALRAGGPPASPRPLQVLALSGGVVGAPFTAGVLVGWTESGTRPTFDVVTGISSGALIGAFAFLGPKYDSHLKRLILTLRSADLVKVRPVCSLLRDGAFGSTKPAERLLQTEINDCFLADLRQAHAEGRRFFAGTMNLDTKRLVVWDMGALASSGRPDAGDLVRKVLLAAFSWPGLVPPVEFNVEIDGHCCREQHADGGAAAMMFLRFGALPGWPERGAPARTGWLAGSNLYVLASRKLYADPEPVPKRALVRTMTSVSAIFEALTRADITRLYSACAVSGMRFHLLALPQEYHAQPLRLGELYPRDARSLFETGAQRGVCGPPWRLTPPGTEPGEEAVPRDGMPIVTCR